MAAPFADPSVGLVTSFYQATGTHGLWGNLEALSINANFLPNALCAASFGLRFAMGAGMMVRRAAFEASVAYHNLAEILVKRGDLAVASLLFMSIESPLSTGLCGRNS